MPELIPHENSTHIEIRGWPEAGNILLWAPEAIMSNTGCSAVYPVGGPWQQKGDQSTQEVDEEGIYGPGNCPRIDEKTFECCGIRFPVDGTVRWKTTVTPAGDRVDFAIRLTNTSRKKIAKAGAAVCVKFVHAGWWSDETVSVVVGGALRSLAELGRDAGLPNGFQAYLLKDVEYDHVFYREFWGFNDHRLDVPVMISQHPDAVFSVAIAADRAYMMHSNPHNPCTDVLLAFGDMEPGATASAAGRIELWRGPAESHPCVKEHIGH